MVKVDLRNQQVLLQRVVSSESNSGCQIRRLIKYSGEARRPMACVYPLIRTVYQNNNSKVVRCIHTTIDRINHQTQMRNIQNCHIYISLKHVFHHADGAFW